MFDAMVDTSIFYSKEGRYHSCVAQVLRSGKVRGHFTWPDIGKHEDPTKAILSKIKPHLKKMIGREDLSEEIGIIDTNNDFNAKQVKTELNTIIDTWYE